jgi:two-component system, sensor histidine kinase PdtaS
VSEEDKGWLAGRFGGLSTGIKMLLILSLGLLPLGIIAVLATIDAARENRVKGEMEARAALAIGAQRLNSAIARASITIRAASDAIEEAPQGSTICMRTLDRLARLQPWPGRHALYGPGNQLRCATPGFAAPPVPDPNGARSRVQIVEGGEVLRLTLFDTNGEVEGISDYGRDALANIATPPTLVARNDLILIEDERRMVLRSAYRAGAFAREVRLSQPLADGALRLDIRAAANPLSAAEMLMVVLPILMWVFAAVIGWLIVDRLLLRPLVAMQKAVSAYRPGDRSLALPSFRSPAREIAALGQAFDQVTRTVARHEADLEAAVDRQTRLVREVHHRVKNNLQVVASLLNLHSRGAQSDEVAAAYASIQRRVDALAVVHRNHYAELEDNRGVAVRPLISELGQNLRGTAPAFAANMQIRLRIEAYHVTQDVAVSVAFLVTEIAEFGMLCGAREVAIALEPEGEGTARLTIESDGLAGEIACADALVERFERIVVGLSRQLRSSLERNPERGRYSVVIAVIARD